VTTPFTTLLAVAVLRWNVPPTLLAVAVAVLRWNVPPMAASAKRLTATRTPGQREGWRTESERRSDIVKMLFSHVLGNTWNQMNQKR
jgi:hypothetical protein